MKPKIKMFDGIWFCVGLFIGQGKTIEQAYKNWRDKYERYQVTGKTDFYEQANG